LEAERVKGTQPSLALERYAGTYRNDLYGEVKVNYESGRLSLRFGPAFTSDLEHWHYDTFRAKFVTAGRANAYVTFSLNAQGRIEDVKLSLPGFAEYPLKRAPDAPGAAETVSLAQAELMKFAGKYESKTPPMEVSIEMLSGKLKAVVPGQPVYDLAPVGQTRFRIGGAPEGFFVQFEMGDERVKSLTFVQGSGPSFVLLPKQ
jgi:Domain of unknown function (DUF3471)